MATTRREFLALSSQRWLDAYRVLGDSTPGDAGAFHFYQMRVVLSRA
jgi:hypothetical protein